MKGSPGDLAEREKDEGGRGREEEEAGGDKAKER